jgi:hypothetical protein
MPTPLHSLNKERGMLMFSMHVEQPVTSIVTRVVISPIIKVNLPSSVLSSTLPSFSYRSPHFTPFSSMYIIPFLPIVSYLSVLSSTGNPTILTSQESSSSQIQQRSPCRHLLRTTYSLIGGGPLPTIKHQDGIASQSAQNLHPPAKNTV